MEYANSRSDVSVFYANSRSLVNKIDQLELEIATYQYDLIVFTDTHLDSSILNSELFPSMYRFSGVIMPKMVDVVVVF